MAEALVEYSRSNGVEPRPDDVKEFEIFPGEGIYGKIDDKDIYVGNKRIALRASCVAVPNLEGMKDGLTVGYVIVDRAMVGIFNLSDTCRTGVAQAIHELKLLGIRTVMLTGDSHAAAMHIHDQLGQAIDSVHAELLPEEKVRIIKELKKDGPTAMVGDGMNDAPALATADVGISMGIAGSAVATETGHVTLMSNDIRKIPKAIRLAQRTRRKIIENIGLSITTKAAIVTLAACGHPLVWAAVVADVGTCLLVIFNSMLLLQGTSTRGRKVCKSWHAPEGHKHGHEDCDGALGHGNHKQGSCGAEHNHLTHAHRRCCSRGSGGHGSCKNVKAGGCANILSCGRMRLISFRKDSNHVHKSHCGKGFSHVRHECGGVPVVTTCGSSPLATDPCTCENNIKEQGNCINKCGNKTIREHRNCTNSCEDHECLQSLPPTNCTSDHSPCSAGSSPHGKTTDQEHVISIGCGRKHCEHEPEPIVHDLSGLDEENRLNDEDVHITHEKHCGGVRACRTQTSILIE